MPKRAKELTAIEVRKLAKPGFHAVGGVAGLYLRINEAAGKSWILRAMVGAKRRDIGLGGFPDVSIAAARDKARDVKQSIVQGIDPIEQRKAARSALIDEQRQGMTFEEAVGRYLDSEKLDEFRNEKHRKQWGSTLYNYAVPLLGSMRLQDITVADIKAVLDPIWQTKNETASRLRGRIETVLNWATASGYRSGENPARWKGNLQQMLPTASKVAKSENHPALPVSMIPAWYMALLTRDGQAAQALAFLALTAARSGEVRGAEWSEMDLNSKIWTIPKSRMKAGREHRVPLSSAAVEILKRLPRMKDVPLVFPSSRSTPISDMTLSAVMRRMHEAEAAAGREGWIDPRLKRPAVPHGIRSTFRDWVSERTEYPRDMAEIALAHRVGSEVELSYRRGDMLEKRRGMMEDWANFLCL